MQLNGVLDVVCVQGRVVSGHKAALEIAMAEAMKKGAVKAAPLAVSGAFHTSLMQPARDALLKVSCHPTFITLSCHVHFIDQPNLAHLPECSSPPIACRGHVYIV